MKNNHITENKTTDFMDTKTKVKVWVETDHHRSENSLADNINEVSFIANFLLPSLCVTWVNLFKFLPENLKENFSYWIQKKKRRIIKRESKTSEKQTIAFICTLSANYIKKWTFFELFICTALRNSSHTISTFLPAFFSCCYHRIRLCIYY